MGRSSAPATRARSRSTDEELRRGPKHRAFWGLRQERCSYSQVTAPPWTGCPGSAVEAKASAALPHFSLGGIKRERSRQRLVATATHLRSRSTTPRTDLRDAVTHVHGSDASMDPAIRVPRSTRRLAANRIGAG